MSYEFRDNRRSSYMAKGRANTPIDVIVIHHWGNDGQNWDNLTAYTVNNRNMSTHYVAMAGKVERQVDEKDTAYHGGNPAINHRSIGIECRPEATDGDYETVAELVADIWSRHGKLPLIGHNQVPSVRPGQQYVATGCPGRYDVERIRKEAEGWYAKKYTKQGSDSSSGGGGSTIKVYPFDNPYRAEQAIQGYEKPLWQGDLKAIKRKGDLIRSVERADWGDSAFVRCADTDAWYLVKADGRWQVSDARPKTHTVEGGDTLWSIAAKYLGDGMRYPEIVEVNRLKTPVILAGQVLELPKK